MRALEEEIGSRLIVRSGRTVTPTAAGLAIVERARNVLREISEFSTIATDETLAGKLRIGAVPTAITGLLPGIMVSLREAYPGVEIDIVPGRSNELYAMAVDGELDAAVIIQPYFAIPKTCAWQTLRAEPLIVLAPAAMAGVDAHTVLATEPFIRYDQSLWGGRQADNYLRQVRIRPHERFELVTLDAIAVLVDRGLGVSLVPDWSPPWPEGLSLAKLPLPGKPPTRHLGLLWGRASVRVRLVQAFLEQAILAAASTVTSRRPSIPPRSRVKPNFPISEHK